MEFLLSKYGLISTEFDCIDRGGHTFHALIMLMSAKNKRPNKCVKPKLTPLYFHSSHA